MGGALLPRVPRFSGALIIRRILLGLNAVLVVRIVVEIIVVVAIELPCSSTAPAACVLLTPLCRCILV